MIRELPKVSKPEWSRQEGMFSWTTDGLGMTTMYLWVCTRALEGRAEGVANQSTTYRSWFCFSLRIRGINWFFCASTSHVQFARNRRNGFLFSLLTFFTLSLHGKNCTVGEEEVCLLVKSKGAVSWLDWLHLWDNLKL